MFVVEFSGVINRTGDFSNSWSNVDISTNTYQYTRATITTSIGIDRNDGNPNLDGEYLFLRTLQSGCRYSCSVRNS